MGKETKTVLYVIFLFLKIINAVFYCAFLVSLDGVDFISSFIYKDLWWLTLIANKIRFRITMKTDLSAWV